MGWVGAESDCNYDDSTQTFLVVSSFLSCCFGDFCLNISSAPEMVQEEKKKLIEADDVGGGKKREKSAKRNEQAAAKLYPLTRRILMYS